MDGRRRAFISASIIWLAIAVGGCSGHGSAPLTPGTQSQPMGGAVQVKRTSGFPAHAPMTINAAARAMDARRPHSSSPGSRRPAPIRHDVALPAGWMSAKTSHLRPQFIAGSPAWSQLPGSVVQVVVSPSDGSLWALAAVGPGPDYPIAHYAGGSWTTVPGDAARLAISPYGDTLWAVNAEGGIYAYTVATQTWNGIGGSASDITVAADGSVYVLSNSDADAGGNFPIWHYANGAWSSVPGSGYRISASWDPNSYPITGATMDPGGFFVFTADTGSDPDGNGNLYFYSPGVGFESVPGQVQAMAPVTGGLFAVSGAAGAGNESAIYFYEYASQGWTEEPGDAVSVAASQTALYSVTSADALWTTPLTLKNPTITEYPVPTANSEPYGIAAGPDGALWFTEGDANKIGRITTGGTITEYPVTTANSAPVGIAAGPDGALWFTEATTNKIGRITTGGTITEYPVPTSNSAPVGIAAGPDGALWFAEGNGNKIGRITTDGTITEYPIPTANSSPEGIAAGPDGALWFAEFTGSKIGRVTTGGTITEYPLPTTGNGPNGIAAGPDGALWFTELGGKIGRVTVGGTITEYSVQAASGPYFIAAGPDGALWFTAVNNDGIGRITIGDTFTEYQLPTASSQPYGIAAGSDGALWFTENSQNKIGRISLK